MGLNLENEIFLRARLQEAEAILRKFQHHNATRQEIEVATMAYFDKAEPSNVPVPLQLVVAPVWMSKRTMAALRSAADKAGMTISQIAVDLIGESLAARAQRVRRARDRAWKQAA